MDTHQDIVIAGVGGQGILTIAGIIGRAAVEQGLHVKQAEVHGMAQRGGSVVTHLRLSAKPIASDLIANGKAQLVLAMEPMEALRQLPLAAAGAMVVTNANPVKNIAGYPDVAKVVERVKSWPRNVVLDGENLAREVGNVRAVNSVMLGAASGFLLIAADQIRAAVAAFFQAKGAEMVALNLKAFDAGRAAARP